MDWIKIDDKTYRYEDKGVRFFLLIGTEYALLLDSGMQVHNAKELARELTDLPIKLFNTHTDPDHIGSNEEFDEIMLNPAELVNYHKPHSSQQIIPVYDGDIIDIGSRPLKAIALPGHTPGSTALLDVNSGIISDAELQMYIARGRRNQPHNELVGITITIDGDYADIDYKYANPLVPQRFSVNGDMIIEDFNSLNKAKQAEYLDMVANDIEYSTYGTAYIKVTAQP